MLHLEQAAPMLGTTFIERMTAPKYAIMRIGNELFTRHQLVTQIGTGNFRAARILANLCARLNLSSVKDLYLISPYQLAAEHGVGVTTLFVLMSLFEAKGLDVMKWYGKGARVAGEDLANFDTLKKRASAVEAEATKREKVATRKRANAKHRHNVGEFMAQNAAKNSKPSNKKVRVRTFTEARQEPPPLHP
jgi:hypothetical protein